MSSKLNLSLSANIQHSSPAERSGKLNIGDQIMSINGTSLVGLPLSTVHTGLISFSLFFITTRILSDKGRQTGALRTDEYCQLSARRDSHY